MNPTLSFVHPTADSPWGTYLMQVDRVVPYLGPLARWASKGSTTRTLAGARPFFSKPPMSALAMLPPPMKTTLG